MDFEREKCQFVSLLQARKKLCQREMAAAQREVSRVLAVDDQLHNRQIEDMALAYPYWQKNTVYSPGEVLLDPETGRLFITAAPVSAGLQSAPSTPGMQHVYRPVPKRFADGSYCFVCGQNVFAQERYTDDKGRKWRALTDLCPCTSPPKEGIDWTLEEGTEHV